MPVHDIDVTVPAATVKNKDMQVLVRADGRVFGRVCISRGSVDWIPANSPVARRMTWERFDQLMNEHGRKVRSPAD